MVTEIEQNRIQANRVYKFSILLLFMLVPIGIMYLWDNNYSLSSPIDNSKFGTFGDFVGGVLGSIWSLCGILLFYTALREQRNDFKTNSDALLKQVDALKVQSEEFKLQREELAQSRQVFIEQSKTQRQQRLESTYFSLLDLYNKVFSDLNLQSLHNSYFKSLKVSLLRKIPMADDPKTSHELAKDSYLAIFYTQKEELSHYFKLIYRILKIIDDSDVVENEKFRYIKILRSQLSENEMLAIYYNSHSVFGGESYKLILKYNLLKHLPCTSKVEFAKYIWELNGDGKVVISNPSRVKYAELNDKSSFLLRFNYQIIALLKEFIIKLNRNIFDEDFDSLKESYNLPLSDGFTIALKSCEIYELSLTISSINNNFDIIATLKKEVFIKYFEAFLYDAFVFSRYEYINNPSGFLIIEEHTNKITFNIESERKLSLNTDIE